MYVLWHEAISQQRKAEGLRGSQEDGLTIPRKFAVSEQLSARICRDGHVIRAPPQVVRAVQPRPWPANGAFGIRTELKLRPYILVLRFAHELAVAALMKAA